MALFTGPVVHVCARACRDALRRSSDRDALVRTLSRSARYWADSYGHAFRREPITWTTNPKADNCGLDPEDAARTEYSRRRGSQAWFQPRRLGSCGRSQYGSRLLGAFAGSADRRGYSHGRTRWVLDPARSQS